MRARNVLGRAAILGLGLLGLSLPAALRAEEAGVAERGVRQVVLVVNPRMDLDRLEARVERRLGEATLVRTHTMRTRRGRRMAAVFDVAGRRAGKSGTFERLLRRLDRTLGVVAAESVKLRPSKARPATLPILQGDVDARSVREQPAFARVAAPAAHGRATGAGMVVAVLDGGFDLRHEMLAGRLTAARYDALDDDAEPQDLGNGVNDDAFDAEELVDPVTDRIVGHGTFVSSIVLSAAPGASVMPVRVIDDEGRGTDLAVALGISYALENGATVINMSLVLPDASPLVKDAVRAAVDSGVLVVAAAGTQFDSWQNDSYIARRSVVVGATGEGDVVTPWTDYDSDVHVFAPGAGVIGAMGGTTPNSYGTWEGTSFSAPFLSAAAALVRERETLSTIALRDRLALSADPAYTPEGLPLLGRGRVNFDRAVRILE